MKSNFPAQKLYCFLAYKLSGLKYVNYIIDEILLMWPQYAITTLILKIASFGLVERLKW
jgi:hypothetical protein